MLETNEQRITVRHQKEFVNPLARAALAVGVNAVFLEVHDRPEFAKCDGPNMITPQQLTEWMPLWLKIDKLVKTEWAA